MNRSSRRIVRHLARSMVTCLALVLATAASAQKPTGPPGGRTVAVPIFKEGIALFDQGYYLKAIVKFKLAYYHFPSPKIHTRLALCYKWLGNNLQALEHYERFLEAFKNPTTQADKVLVKQVKMEVRNLLMLVGQLTIQMAKPAGADIRVNGLKIGEAPIDRTLRLVPGPINVTATHKGFYTFKRDLQLNPSQKVTVKISLVKIKPKVIKKVVMIHETPIYKRWWFWTAIGALVAGGAAGIGAWQGTKTEKRSPSGIPLPHDGLSIQW